MARRCSRATSRFTENIEIHLSELLISTGLLCLCLFLPSTAEAGLYTASDQILVLTPEDVDSILINSTAAIVVEFYASWCGHCIAFSPIYKSLARDIKEWKPAVDLAAIDCAVEENRKICIDFGIRGYPTIKFFHAYSTSDSTGQAFKGFPREVRGLRQNVIDRLEAHEEHWPPACPPLEPTSQAEIDSFFETNNVEHLALIFEDSDSYVGREVTLDLLQYDNVAVRRVLRSEEGLVAKLGVTEFPSCYLYYPGGNFTRLQVQNEARTFYSYALQRLPGVLRSGMPRPVTSDLHTNNTEEPWRTFNRSRVYMADLESVLHYSLRVELAAHPIIKGEALSALKRYVSVLTKVTGHI
ncbi:sulfhydryl oxidase 1 [Polymixia lowei]